MTTSAIAHPGLCSNSNTAVLLLVVSFYTILQFCSTALPSLRQLLQRMFDSDMEQRPSALELKDEFAAVVAAEPAEQQQADAERSQLEAQTTQA